MPKGFESCRASRGGIRTVVPKKGRYIHVCFRGGKSYRGEVKHTKGK